MPSETNTRGFAANRLLGGDPRSQFNPSDVSADIATTLVTMTAEDGAVSRGILWTKVGTRPRVGVHIMHPRADHSGHYTVLPLVQAGYAVLARTSRWPGNDVATIHENLLLDVAAGVRWLHDFGCEHVVLLGSSGGGPVATMYQWQARLEPPARLRDTAAGDPLDLNGFDLPPASGLVLVGTHLGEGEVMGRCLDPAIVDERDPLVTDPRLDLYDPRNGYVEPPQSSKYSQEFLDVYRAEQLNRARRLDNTAKALIARQRDAAERYGTTSPEELDIDAVLTLQRTSLVVPHMIIYRTMADPAMVDLSLDPDDRPVRTYIGPNAHRDNYDESGFARYVTPRAWLSTWSPLSTRARTAENLAHVTDPLLLVAYLGDCGMRRSDVRLTEERSASTDKEVLEVPGVDHYGSLVQPDGSSGPRGTAGTDRAISWLRERYPL